MSCRRLLALALGGGCGIGSQMVRHADEMPAGTCARQKLAPGESCETDARDYSAGATVGVPHGHAGEVGGTAWFRWPLFDVSLDERTLRRGAGDYHSVAGGIGTHLRPLSLVPRVGRYLDPHVDLGLELGGIAKDSHLEGRGDGYIDGVLELYLPDVGALRYVETGVPGLRVGVRYTAFVQGWASEITFELGLVWRWGEPIDLYHHWTTQRTGD